MAENGKTAVMPELEEAAALVPPKDGIVWRLSGDVRVLNAAGYTLLLQVAHPTVGAGVSEHSNFRADPWGRLFRTLDYTSVSVYGGPRAAWEVGRRIRKMHKRIKGVLRDGSSYHALEPKAYAWVHATLAEGIIRAHEFFGFRLTDEQLEAFWAEWVPIGRLVGVRESDLPPDWASYQGYFDETVDGVLENNDAVQDVVASLDAPAPPPLPGLREPLWRVLRYPAKRASGLATIGMLPPRLRERLELPWTERDARELRMMSAVSKRARPLMTKDMRCFGPRYLELRREAIERGDVGSGKGTKFESELSPVG